MSYIKECHRKNATQENIIFLSFPANSILKLLFNYLKFFYGVFLENFFGKKNSIKILFLTQTKI